MTAHSPRRPVWTCDGCSQDWPCPTARKELLAAYDGAMVSLALVLSARLVDAAYDLPAVPAGVLHARMVGWLRQVRRQQITNGAAAARMPYAARRTTDR